MGKLGKLWKAFTSIVRQPSLLNLIIDTNQNWYKYVEKRYGLGAGLPVAELSTLFPDFRANIPTFAFLDGGSLPTDIALLMKLAQRIPDCSYFEIGTWRGESVVNVANIAKECYTLNLPDEEMRKAGQPENFIELIGFFSKDKKNITHLKGNSFDFDFVGLNKKFDLIFIDGDHHYEAVKNDTKKIFESLVHDKSVVVWHDYARSPEVVRFEVFAGILDGMLPQRHRYLYHVGNTLSAIYYPSEALAKHPLINPTKPNHYFELYLKLNPIVKKE